MGQLLAELDAFTLSQYTPLKASLDTFLLSRQAKRCTPATLHFYRHTLGPFIDWLRQFDLSEPGQITAHHIRAYLLHLQERGLKDTTQHACARSIKAWLNWLLREEEIDKSPMLKVDMPKVDRKLPDVYTVEEVNTLLAACDRKTLLGLRNYAVILCLLDSGLRRAELADLRLPDVNLQTGLVIVRSGKGGKQRQSRFGARARAALLRYLARVPELTETDPIFGLQSRGLQITLYRLGKRAGVEPCNAHRFRRTFATFCLKDNMDLERLRMLMGHSSLAVLQRYLALTGRDLEQAHAAHSPVDRWLERG